MARSAQRATRNAHASARRTPHSPRKAKGPASIGGTILTLIIVVLYLTLNQSGPATPNSSPQAGPTPATTPAPAATTPPTRATSAPRVRDGLSARSEGLWIEDAGKVVRILDDDDDGSRHQRFIVDVGNDTTVLIAHNIDLAPRAPVARGDRVSFRGEYIWNEQGGVVHWTHHDPGRRRAGGWIELDSKRYE